MTALVDTERHGEHEHGGADHRHGEHGHGEHGHGEHGHGHGEHGHGDHAELFRRRFWVTLALTVPVVVTSHMVMGWLGYELEFTGQSLFGPVLGTVIVGWGGWPFLSGGVAEARSRKPGMMLLIAMAIVVAYAASAATSLGFFDLEFWWELALLVTIMLLGHWQEMKALGQAGSALEALAEMLPDEAERIESDGTTRTVSVGDLRLGDRVLVRSGSRVPADGVVVDGTAEVDESMITGESRPVTRGPGSTVVAGTVATDSAIRVEVRATGDDTALAGIQRLVAQAQASGGRAQALADRFAGLLFYVATGAAAVTFVSWWAFGGDLEEAVVRTVTVLVISCPHALGLAIPLVVSLSTGIAARRGILVKDRLALERMRTVDAVLFDKTGTLTRGAHVVTGVATAQGMTESEALRIAGAVESDSEHPLAKAIVKAAGTAGVASAADFRSITGRGVEATVDGRRWAVGGPALLRERGVTVPAELREAAAAWHHRGAAVLHLVGEGGAVAAFALEDEVRPEAREAIRRLRQLGKGGVMITGDAASVADAVGRDLGVDEVLAEVLPEDKEAKVADLQGRGLSVAMVGDGVNDAPALARADVGLAIGAGTDVAIESAGVVLASSDPRAVTDVITLSKASYRKMVQNLAWAAGYNVAAIPLAGGALAWAGLNLPPAVGAVLMSASTVVVAANAQLLRRAPTGRRGGLVAAGVASVAVVAIGLGLLTIGRSPNVDRTVEVAMTEFELSPDTYEVIEGETVRFRFVNDGDAVHDAFISEVGESAGHAGHDSKALVLEPGERGDVVRTLDESGTYEIACHQPGHLDAGMRASIAVRPSR
jgi:P-type Cu2+ transporter